MKKKRMLLMLLFLVLFLSGCGRNAWTGEADAQFLVYSVNREDWRMVSIPYRPQAENGSPGVEEMLSVLQGETALTSYVPPMTGDVILREYHMEADMLTLDFDVRYLDMDRVTEVYTRAAIVLSLLQADGVEHVLFLVAGSALTADTGEPVGVMGADTFVLFDGQ